MKNVIFGVVAAAIVASIAFASEKERTAKANAANGVVATTTASTADVKANGTSKTDTTTAVVEKKAPEGVEKCYGVVRQGKGECANPSGTCKAGEESIMLPIGICEKLNNGSVKAPVADMKAAVVEETAKTTPSADVKAGATEKAVATDATQADVKAAGDSKTADVKATDAKTTVATDTKSAATDKATTKN
ncbi:MAG: DUF2282 domain-containing protein [Proteobacteria bacterium]|nr:DUF2282 domain-containing protein [Pseudomonadota bacterium]